MAWTISEQGTPYYKPAEPEVPKTNNVPAELIMQGTRNILEAAISARSAELSREKMLQDADIAAKDMELKREQLAQDYDLKKTYYNLLSSRASETEDRQRTGLEQQTRQANARQKWYDSIDENDSRATQAIGDLKLNDATRITDDPVGFLGDAKQFINRFKGAVEGQAPKMVQDLQTKVDQMKVPFIKGAVYGLVDPNNPKLGYAWSGYNKTPVDVPLEQIVQQWQDPRLRQGVENGIIAAGHGSIIDTIKKTKNGFFSRTQAVTTHTPTLDDYGNQILTGAGKVNLNAGTNEVPDLLKRKRTQREINDSANALPPSDVGDSTPSPAAGSDAVETGTPSSTLPPGSSGYFPPTGSNSTTTPAFEPTATDKVIAQARAILNVNPGAKAEIARRLSARGIDPGVLDEVA